MKLTIENFRGIERAEIDLLPIALVYGSNCAGKSSVAEALAIALRRSSAIHSSGLLLRSGAKAGAIAFDRAEFKTKIPVTADGIDMTNLPRPIASPVACGLKSFPTMNADAAAAYLADFDMRGTIPDATVTAALTEIGIIHPDSHKTVLKRINDAGWDGAWSDAGGKGAKLRTEWQTLTGTEYLPDSAGGWRPAGWPTIMEDIHADSIHECIANKKREIEAIQNGGVDSREAERLRHEASRLEGCKAENQKIVDAIQANTARVEALERQGGDSDRAEILNLEKTNRELIHQKQLAEEYIHAAETASLQFAALESSKAAPPIIEGDAPDAILELRDELARHESSLKIMQLKDQAQTIHSAILLNEKLQILLSPSGLRKSNLAGAIAKLNASLAHLSVLAGWPVVSVANDLLVFSFNGTRPFAALSKSERFRVTILLQVATALMDKSAAIIIDGADTLDRQGRNGLMRLIRETKLRALVTMTANDPKDCPLLEKAGLGKSYWCAGGKVIALADAQQEKPAKGVA